MRVVKLSIMLMGAALLLLLAGALPLGGVPSVYRGGLMAALGAALSVASLYAAFRLSGRAWWRLLLALVMGFLFVGGVAAVWMYGAQALRFAAGGEWRWLGGLGFLCTAFFGAGMAAVGGFGVWRLMNKHLWLAAVHLSLVAMGLGVMADRAGEVKGLMAMPSAQNKGRPTMHAQFEDAGKAVYPFGFAVGVKNFDVTYYEGNTYGLYAYEGRAWKRLASAEAKDGTIAFPGGVEVASNDVKPLPGMPRPMFVLGGGKVVVKEQPPVKSYEALCRVEDGEKTAEFTVRVNEPLFYGDWMFYLSSYREGQGGHPVVLMTARRSPGRIWMLGGIAGLLVATAFWCWMPGDGKEVAA